MMRISVGHTGDGPHIEVAGWDGDDTEVLSTDGAFELAHGLRHAADPDNARDRVVLDDHSVWARREDGLVRITVGGRTCPVSPSTAEQVAAHLLDPEPSRTVDDLRGVEDDG